MKNTKHQESNTRKAPSTKCLNGLANGIVHYPQPNGEGAGVFLRDEPLSPEADSSTKPVTRHPFDLEARTACFGERIVRFAKKIPRNPANDRMISQIVGAGTSVGANYCEANDCFSKKDFRFTIKRCLKEAKETRFFLRMIAASEPALVDEARDLYREATELTKIFAAMYRK